VCRHLGVLTSADIRRIRERYGMTRSSFAEVTGLGEATLKRWENGVIIQNRANDRYLRLLAIPTVMVRLQKLLVRPLKPVSQRVADGGSRFRILDVAEIQQLRRQRFQLRIAS
jgi:transcriptional regulator with XRE-family HTH domain